MKTKLLKTLSLLLALSLLSAFILTSCSDESDENPPQGDVVYAIDPSFQVRLNAISGDFDTDGDGENDFSGIALDVYVESISLELKHGIAGVDAQIHFDNTRLEPLFKTSEELNGISGAQDPRPVYSFPQYSNVIDSAGVAITLFSVDGLCNAYAHTDGGYTNPDNEKQKFTGSESYISCNYIIDMETHVAWNDGKNGLTNEDHVCFRYYFKVLDDGNAPYVFTVPDSPEETVAARSKLCAPYFDGKTFDTVTGKGATIEFIIK